MPVFKIPNYLLTLNFTITITILILAVCSIHKLLFCIVILGLLDTKNVANRVIFDYTCLYIT